MRTLGVWLATVGGAGYAPVAPGTVGSAVGVVVYLLIKSQSVALQVAVITTIAVVGTWAAHEAAAHFGRKDPGHVVIDEVAGQLVTFCLLDVGWLGCLLGFLIFRGLDIVKPWPARRFERLPGGVGIMADDLMAGAYGWVLMRGAMAVVKGL